MKKICFSILICVMLCAVIACALIGCSSNALPRPVGLRLDGPTLTLSWRADENAKYYIVSIKGNELEDEKNTRKNSFSLANLGLAEGDYELRVKACADGKDFSDSAWSEPLTFSQDKDTGLTFKFNNNNKEAEVVSLGRASGDVTIPDTYRGVPVTKIGERAFTGKSALKGVVIGNNVTTIGASAFANCASLEKLTFSQSVTEIGTSAFQSCRSLSGTLTIPEKVTSINKLAFAYCTAITDLKLNNQLQSIGESAFTGCEKLQTLNIPDSVHTINGYAFSPCTSLKTVNFGSGLTYIGEYAFALCDNIESLTFNEGLRSISQFAFAKCGKLAAVTFSDSVETISNGVFYDDPLLTNVTFGSGIKTVGASAFRDTAIWKNSNNEVYLCNWFLGFKDYTAITANVTIQNGTVGISNYSLSSLPEIVSTIILPDSVKIIGTAAFAHSKLSSVVIGSGVEEVGVQAFYDCDRLTMAVLGSYDVATGKIDKSSVKLIGNQAFYDCKSLETIEIPSTVEAIDSQAFNGTALYKNSVTGIVYADKWLVGCDNSKANGVVIIKDGTVGIAKYAFYQCDKISGAQIPDSVTMMGRSVFYQCTNLVSVKLPSALEELPDYTFYGCTNLMLPELPATLKSIGRSAFYKCALSNGEEGDTDNDVLVIPDSVETIGDYAFFSTGYTFIDYESGGIVEGGIDSVQMGNGVKHIGEDAFYTTKTLKSVTLGNSVETIGEKAFYKCASIVSVSFNEGLQSIGAIAFYGCNGLTSVTLPNGLRDVGNYAFYKCTGLTELKLGNVQSIGECAFYGCSNLTALVLPDSVNIGKQAFRSCIKLQSVTISSNVSNINDHAFYGCNSLTIYAQNAAAQSGWSARFNSSYRPVVWGCTLVNGYVYSVIKNDKTITNLNDANKLSAPQRVGYEFVGWSTVKDAATAEYSAEEFSNVAGGTTLYAVWKVK